MGCNLLINWVYWSYNPLILTSWDIQVGCFFQRNPRLTKIENFPPTGWFKMAAILAGQLTFERVTFSPSPKRSPAELPGSRFCSTKIFMKCHNWCVGFLKETFSFQNRSLNDVRLLWMIQWSCLVYPDGPGMVTLDLKLTATVYPKKIDRAAKKETFIFQPSIFRGDLLVPGPLFLKVKPPK